MPKLSAQQINAMPLDKLRATTSRLEWSRCQAWKKYYAAQKTILQLEAQLAKYKEGSTDEEVVSSTDDDEGSIENSDDEDDEPLINLLPKNNVPPPTHNQVLDKNGKPKKWCELCEKHISRDNFATHVKTTKKHQTN